jgi:Na+/H+ antiporter NhaD/arsenite permease-like protein
MAVITLLSATIACLPLPALFTIALFAFQIMVQLSVPLYFGIFSKFGNRQGATGGMIAGIATVCALQFAWPIGVPWADGLTTGVIGLLVNLTVFLLAGVVIANIIGTAGASILLILPLLRTNRERKITAHIPVFFIFVVSNIGGCLTPIGDAPLFLGYLRGVPFTWTLGLFPEWLIAMIIILTIFYFWDRRAYHLEAVKDIRRDTSEIEPLRLKGWINFIFLIGVMMSIAFQVPAPYRELIMAAMALLSLIFTKKDYREANKFSYHPIVEVIILFAGIFITMVPLLVILHEKGAALGLTRQWHFFWGTGLLSSFLDNAPTYLTFFSAAENVTAHIGAAGNIVAGVDAGLLRAISLGAVFMGANTYIGNGPNFMVKAIADRQGIKTPHFFGYMVYSTLILIPVFLIITLIFLRG